MSSIGSLNVDLKLENAQFIAGIKRAQQETAVAAKSIQGAFSMMKGAAIGLVGALSIDALANQTRAAFDFADAIVDLSNQTGASTKVLQEFRYAAQMSGSSVESADAAIAKFTKNLGSALNGNQAMAKSFRDLGVTAGDPDKALRQFMDGIAKLPTAAQRQSAAMAIMGKSAGDLTALLGEGSKGFDGLAEAARGYGIVIEDSVLQNAGKVNDQLDTMKMIVDAQMANAIVQNADALMALANGFVSAAAGAAQFFQNLNVAKLMSVANGVNMSSDIPTLVKGRMQGKSIQQVENEARAELKTTGAGRSALHADITKRYNDNIRAGRNPKDSDMQAMLAEREDIARAEVAARRGRRVTPGGTGTNLRIPGAARSAPRSSPKSSTPQRSDAELDMAWRREWLSVQNERLDAESDLSTSPSLVAENKAKRLRNDWSYRQSEIERDTGSDQEVREGKKRYTAAQAAILKEAEKELFDLRYDATMRDARVETSRERLDVALANNANEQDDLQSQAQLARSSKERRDIALRLVALQFQRERLQLEEIVASEKSTDAEKAIAKKRLEILGKLQGRAEEVAKQETQGPLGEFMSSIPKTADEINDAIERVQVEGLQGLQDDMLGVIKGTKSIGDAFSSMADTIIDGLLRIAIQQLIIKPLGSLLMGSGESGGGGGGLLGSIIRMGISAIPGGSTVGMGTPPIAGARANGGLTRAGDYLMGERGPEIVRVGNTANVMPTRALSSLQNDDRGGLTVKIDSITSNDPEMVRRMVAEGVMQATPMIAAQATDRTMAKLRRGSI